ncbi:MAG TPA: SRPBCC family protein [Ktedonobacteraceae bacterium]|nr:SRPBCC family protein [Ktedonobacteraceae bacterium]
MPDLHFSIGIHGSAETIFALIAAIDQYDRWLPGSAAFGSVSQVSPIPIGLGTKYTDTGSSGTMHGSITAYQPPMHITFQQSMPVKLLIIAGTLTLQIRYILEPLEQETRVDREVSFHLENKLKVAQPFVVATVRRESKRILQVLKQYVESQPENT